jgi:hypothetical protein
MANPKVRPHLSFYPEDSRKAISEARQADRWLQETDNDQITPMAHLLTGDYYIHEPAMLRDGTCCIPVRWFEYDKRLFAKCWKMDTITSDVGEGWRITKCDDWVVENKEFLKAFPELRADAEMYGLPNPSCILGSFSTQYN